MSSASSEAASSITSPVSFTVDDFTGAAHLSYPIAVPPARGGLAPQLALNYSSSAGNGWIGVGWDLNLGYIQRRGPRKAVPTYDDTKDVFELNLGGGPQELIPIGGNAYRLRIEGAYLEIQYYTSGNYWTVRDKLGNVMRFGYTQDSKIGTVKYPSVSANTYRWCFEQIFDPKRNYMEITYVRDEDEWGNVIQIYPQEISYNGNFYAGILPNHSVTFILDSSRTDTSSNYRAGFKMDTRKRLSSIEVRGDGVLVRSYGLRYASPNPNARSLLEAITLYGNGDPPLSIPTTFTYQTHTHGFDTPVSWSNPSGSAIREGLTLYGLYSGPTKDSLDINGDGLVERVVYDPAEPYDTWTVYHNDTHGFIVKGDGYPWDWSNWSAWSYYEGNYIRNNISQDGYAYGTYTEVLDLNGDGRPDRVVFNRSCSPPYTDCPWSVYFNTGDGFATTPYSWPNPSAVNAVYGNYIRNTDGYGSVGTDVIDMNGDGLPDRVDYVSAQSNWKVYLNTGYTFDPNYITWTIPTGAQGYYIRQYDPLGGGCYVDIVDMNGDGLPDRVIKMFGSDWQIYFNNGAGFQQDAVTWADPDGSAGLIRTTYVDSNEHGFSWSWTFGDLIDLNGDGLPDRVIVDQENSQWKVYFNNGGGFGSVVTWQNATSYIRSQIANDHGWWTSDWDVFDIDGDGLVDWVGVSYPYNYPWGVYSNSGPVPDLLSRVVNGIGGTIDITYRPSTAYDNTGTDGKPDLPFVVQTVWTYTEGDGRGNFYTHEYTYRNGYYNAEEAEFRGFSVVTACQPNCGEETFETKTETYFHQSSYLTGKLALQVLTSWDGHTRQVVNSWDTYDVWTTNSKFPRLNETISTVTDLQDGIPYSYQHKTTYLYDTNLNVKEEHKWHLEGSQFVEDISTHFKYTNNPNDPEHYPDCMNHWILSKPTEIKVKDGSGAIVSAKWMDYNCDTGNITKEEVCKSDNPNAECGVSNETQNSVIRYEYYGPSHLPMTGNLWKTRDPNENWTEVTYDSNTQTHVRQTTNALGHVTTTEYDFGTGNLVKLVPPHLQNTDYWHQIQYDDLGRKIKEQLKDDSHPNADLGYTAYAYVNFGNPNAQYVNKIEHIVVVVDGQATRILDHYTTTLFDGMGRTYEVQGSGPEGKTIKTTSEFDSLGRVWRKSNPYLWLGVPLETQYYTTFTYDGLSRVIEVEMPDTPANTFISTTYQGLRKVVEDQRGFFKANTYDVYQRLTKVEEYDEIGAGYSTTEYKYDTMGNLIEVKAAVGMPEQNITTMEYDSLSKKKKMIDPDMGTWIYDYDKNGNLVYQKDGNLREITFTYDTLNRVTQKTYVNSSPAERVTYCYDDPDYCIPPYPPNPPIPPVPFSKGALIRVLTLRAGTPEVEVARDRILAYDELQRVKQSSKKIEIIPGAYEEVTFEKTYDSAGRAITVKSIGTLLTKQYNYEYDVAGNLLNIKDNAEPQYNVVRYSNFTALGQPRLAEFRSWVSTTYDYYAQTGRLNTLFTTKYGTQDYQNLSYGYDAKGNITTITDSINYFHTGTISHTYTYDALDRLKTAIGTGTNWYDHTYQYDRIGNIIYKSQVEASGSNTFTYTYDYPVKPHAVKTVGSNSPIPIYNDSLINIEYNHDQKPKLIKRNLVDYIRFTYDGNGQRVKKENLAAPQTTLYFGDLYEERGSVEIVHVFAGNRRVASIRSDGNHQYYHPNHLGSASVVTGQNGDWRQRIEYHPFGTYLVDEKNSDYSNFPDANYTFTDQEDDDDIGLYNYGARLYDPVIGRFISPDRLVQAPENPQSLNRYSYCLNNPLIYTDPSGEFFWFAAAVFAGALFGAGMAAATGGNIALGALTGAISGAAFFGAGAAIGELGLVTAEGAYVSTEAAIAGASIHFAAGTVSGGINAAITGGNVGMGAITGGISAGIAEGLGNFIPSVGNKYADFAMKLAGRAAIGGTTGGITAEIYGGNFGQGFALGAGTAAAGFLFNHGAHWVLLRVVAHGVPVWKNTETGEVRYGQKPDIPDPTMQAVNEALTPYAVGYFAAISLAGGALAAPSVVPYAVEYGTIYVLGNADAYQFIVDFSKSVSVQGPPAGSKYGGTYLGRGARQIYEWLK
jgi:RHS repeat-associated protein